MKPLILITNDDGITSKGIGFLVNIMHQIGEVVVVAPDSPQSGMGHAITIHDPLKYYESDIFSELGIKAYQCSGTPADCVKLAKNHILDRLPDLVVSGVNHGSNSSVSILYSGTMSAALEATIEGLPALGFSVCDYSYDAEFDHTKELVSEIAKKVIEKGLPSGTALNVNFPKVSDEPIKGFKYCRQAKGKWQEEFDERTDPSGRRYLWLTGKYVLFDEGNDTDEWAINNNYASVVPVKIDLTDHDYLQKLLSE
ncbi:5'/3'-nucleotidase SurE [Flammeovirga yaeyamensis]|uniref:5'-nucleotidase SurE n=1 Tax=Flammeovirga yaeyamensis TaxID=367791 RepID=A0AAX1NCH8_9BACT|nr:5'/3'-nucleotidase SurE [Flammeovirga yaeyamensis]MBB3698799.1 5'-nucleotidase [Flammeovirga yaeyamensis]NMF37384.1 5'/3'-nucleotidase SurE [Flammeovirga yaeyamensis]QWG03802.1 5'/3'-nucleotidase SurE [Flammeovirga yaeyamensis]